jgi:radical SAM protein with 4Fe4S-binding SPASM domain
VFRIEPCSLCNLRCPSCASHQAETTEKRVMDFDDFAVIISKIRSVALRASLYDMGEPLMHKDIYRMIRLVTDNHISSLISTNFNLFGSENIDDLFDSGLTVLEPCLDGFTQEVYEKYRATGNVETVKRGIQMVMDHKRSIKSKYPFVDVQVVLFNHIMHEILQIEEFLQSCKVDNVTFRQENLGFDDSNVQEPKSSGNKSKTCFWLYLGMMIRPDGSVYPCCGRDFDRFSYGNILHESLDEIWNNKYYRLSREIFVRGDDMEPNDEMRKIPCWNCPRRTG